MIRQMITTHGLRNFATSTCHHPDTGATDDPDTIRQVNAAHRVLLDYVNVYSFTFTEEEFYEQNPEERIRMQFADDSLWGKR